MMMEPKIKLLLNCIYGTKCLKRKDTQEMKFGIGDKVKILTSGYDHCAGADVTIIDAAHLNNGKSCYRISINGNPHPCAWYDYELELLASYKGPAEFTKSDLKDGMVVEYRNGKRALVIAGHFVNKFGFMSISSYDDGLINIKNSTSISRDYDIRRVYRPKSNEICNIDHIFESHRLDLVWKREEEPKPKYKVGDRVKMREDLATGKFTMPVEANMSELAGKIVTITHVLKDRAYTVDRCLFFYSEDMIEGLVDYEEMTVAEIEKKLGYKVKIVDGE